MQEGQEAYSWTLYKCWHTPRTAGHQKKRLGAKPSPSIWSDFHDAKMLDRQSISESHTIFNNEYDFADRNIASPSLAKEH